MTLNCGKIFYAVLVLLASVNAILSQHNHTEERVKRNNEFHIHAGQSRRLGEVKGFSPSYNKVQPPSPTSQVRPRHTRPKPIHVPPYAVKMEPLVQYSQRDPLYHDKEIKYNITSINEKTSKEDSYADAANNFVDYSPNYGPPSFDQGYPSHHYYKEPEPIIEIIIKESNETLPTEPATTQLPSPKPTKEPIQVFYVKYKKNSNTYGKDEVVYEEPVPALTPISTDIVENHSTEPTFTTTSYPTPPPPSTTYRTIIRPDSEIYHGTGLKVTFGKPDEPSYPAPFYEQRSSEAQKRDSVVDQNEAQDYKTPGLNEPESPPKHLLEQRQGQNEYARFVNTKHEPVPTHAGLRQNTISGTQSVGLPVQPLQFEDGSYERPPPPTYLTNANHAQPRIVFPSQIPFRPQHNLNFQPQGSEFPPELRQPPPFHPQNNLQNVKQPLPQNGEINQQQFQQIQNVKPQQSPPHLEFSPEIRPQQFQHSGNAPTKSYPRLTQAIIPLPQSQPQPQPQLQSQPQHQQNQQPIQYPNQDPSFTGNKVLFSAPNDGNRLLIQRQPELHQPTKPSRIVQPPLEASAGPYAPQPTHHSQIPYRNEFAQQFSNQKPQYQQTLPHQPHQHLQPQLQAQQSQFFQEKPLADRQKQFYEKQRPQINQKPLQRRPFDEKYQPQEYINQLQTEKSEVKPQPTNAQPNYKEIVPSSRPRVSQKPQPPKKNDLPAIQDGQIYKSISHSEEHQILNQLDSFNSNSPKQESFNTNSILKLETYNSNSAPNKVESYNANLNPKQESYNSNTHPKLESYSNSNPQFESYNTNTAPKLESYSNLNTKYESYNPNSAPKLESYSNSNPKFEFNTNSAPKLESYSNSNHKFESYNSNPVPKVESHNSNQAAKLYQNQNVQYISSQPEVVNYNKPPKQTFEQHPYYTTSSKPNTKKEKEKINVTYTTIPKVVSSNKKEKNDSKSLPSQLAALPDEVPDDLREQLLSSGILSNADIQILDYDKVGDIPIESLPPEALENLYGAGSAPVPSYAFPNTSKSVEMKVVRYNSTDQTVQSSYVQEDSTEVDPVVLNDSSYNRYLPLKVKGSQFPIPDSPLLKNKKITSVVVLAPVDYDYVRQEEERKGKSVPQVHGVRFISGESLKTLVKNPTENNFLRWIEKEKETPPNKQSVILLVTNSTDDDPVERTEKEIFMYDIPTGEISKLEGELSSAFVNVAESNAESEDLDNLSENSDGSTPVSRMTSIPVYGTMSEQFKSKSRRSS